LVVTNAVHFSGKRRKHTALLVLLLKFHRNFWKAQSLSPKKKYSYRKQVSVILNYLSAKFILSHRHLYSIGGSITQSFTMEFSLVSVCKGTEQQGSECARPRLIQKELNQSILQLYRERPKKAGLITVLA
jgi:exopolyphosphatase/pppGpp-phosphohydrolase